MTRELVHAKPVMSQGELAFLAWLETDETSDKDPPMVIIKQLPDVSLKEYLEVVAELIDN